MKEKFDYNYDSISEEEKNTVLEIREAYVKGSKKSMYEELLSLHNKTKSFPRLISIIIGVIGFMIFGIGQALVLSYQKYVLGSIIGVCGIVIMSINYQIYKFLYKRTKKYYSSRILELSEALLQKDE